MTKKQNHKQSPEELVQQIAELTDQLQRERADAMNVRRRAEEEKLKMASYYKAQVIRELLPVLDNFERSLKHVPSELAKNDYLKGINAVVKQFETTLEKIGLKRIKTVGEPFNPELHEAISAEGEGEHEIVSEELQSGWMVGEEIIRHAMVRVTNQ